MQRIFIVGEQRSGSNVLRLMMSQAGIAAPHPPHLLTRFRPLVESYGDLGQDSNWHQLVNDACQLIERNPVSWGSIEIFDREDIKARCRERSLIAIFGALMDTYAESLGVDAWACKSMQYSKFGRELDAYFEDPKYVYLHRDGRDVTLSFTKAVVGEKHPYHIAKRWARLQAQCLEERERIPERYFTLCYEAMTGEPEPVLRQLCDFLEVPFSVQMMDFHRSSAAQSTSDKSQLWQNLSRPIMRNNSKKFLRGLSEDHIRIVETVAGEALEALDYERVFVQPGQERVFSAEELETYTAENEELKKTRRSMMEDSDAERRAHQLSLLTERVYFMSEFSHSDALRFLSFVYEEHLVEGSVMVEEGELERDIFFVISGEANVLHNGDQVNTLKPGECVGEVGALGGCQRTATVQAATPMRVFRLTWAKLGIMRSDAPDLALKVLWAISARLAQRFKALVDLSHCHP